MKYILASASPRRKEILSHLGLAFTVLAADADETCDITDPGERVEFIALKKCLAARDKLISDGMNPADNETVIIASDTLVTLDGEFLGKPRDEATTSPGISSATGTSSLQRPDFPTRKTRAIL